MYLDLGVVSYSLSSCVSSRRFFSAPEDRSEQLKVLGALAGTAEAGAEIAKFFFEKTRELIKSNSFNLSGSKTRSVNIVRDVLKAVPIHWVADIVSACKRWRYPVSLTAEYRAGSKSKLLLLLMVISLLLSFIT